MVKMTPNYEIKRTPEVTLRSSHHLRPAPLISALGLGRGVTDALEQCAVTYFNRWLDEALAVSPNWSVRRTLDALNAHPIASDGTSQDYFMPSNRYYESPGKFRIFGENQDIWYCFAVEGMEERSNPEIYFECEGDERGQRVICDGFQKFLWFMLARFICARMVRSPHVRENVSGILFKGPVSADGSFFNPIGEEFPDGFSCWISECVILMPHWGAAFLHEGARKDFIEKHTPTIRGTW